jgi:tRNA(Ile)-lysidine synthase
VSVADGWPMDQGKDAGLLLSARDAFPPDGVNKVGVAVSGGGDSIALLHLMHRVAPQMGWQVHAVTVDHALRVASVAEAAGVATYCASLGVPHTTLRWDHGDIAGNLMDAARQARMRLIGDWAQARGIAHVALGHTADDQAETFLMGLARASGLDGLAGMRRCWREGVVMWGRPLLGQSRTALRAYLQRHGIGWVDDPTNDDDSFTRIKARKALAVLAPLGITVESLTATVGHLTLARYALRQMVTAACHQHVMEQTGALHITRAAFAAMPDDVQRRLILAAISWLSGDPYPPRSDKQTTLLFALRDGRHATLNGCRFRVGRDVIRILREPKAVACLETPTTAPWDNRWHLDGPHAPGLTIRALGDGIRYCPGWRATGLPRDALLVTPAVWRGEVLISAPLAGFAQGWTATLRPGFTSFLLSH